MNQKQYSELKPIFIAISLFIVFILAWSELSLFFQNSHLPGPFEVATAFAFTVTEKGYWTNIVVTMGRVLIGFISAFMIGSLSGILIGSSKLLEQAIKPYIFLGLTIPALCWGVIAIIVFGISEFTAIFVISVVVAPIISLNFLSGIQSLDKDLMEMAKVYNIRQLNIVRKIILPQLAPYTISAIRMGLALSWKVVVIVEMLGISSGIGYQIIYWFNMFEMKRVIAWTLSFSILMLIMEYFLVRPLELELNRWRYTHDKKSFVSSYFSNGS
ncbi:MAG: ABC transporter permease [Magnetococcales bacterium]|nr:ABC transporter permease [Magnetococcales bacterium]